MDDWRAGGQNEDRGEGEIEQDTAGADKSPQSLLEGEQVWSGADTDGMNGDFFFLSRTTSWNVFTHVHIQVDIFSRRKNVFLFFFFH